MRLAHRIFPFLPHLAALLPSACALCAASCDAALCGHCRARYLGADAQRCLRCALPLPSGASDATCGACLHTSPAFDATVTAADYGAPLDQLVVGLKFAGKLALAPALAHGLRDAVIRQRDAAGAALPDLLACVPLGERRLVERGYNQALEIARPLGKALGIPVAPTLLARVKETRPQSLLAPPERRDNIRRAFAVDLAQLDMIKGRHVGVVDDVMTTGATLEDVAATLKRHGASRVTNLVFARTPQH